ncbi:hypothetical protein [Cytobacillus purgationiresistens]|uniref:ABC-type cobalamin/Fe3+-siderophores transport system ATPase subunit n=1 Tax=Cytobacillus purgationiresistens TaxID=863449 RepID=A0ABU0ANC1_9BACI|nr:hypothetical protein [Cytobacillus purgationiresistens]MDQ0271893.1 ABC-type cobalamin/Fe3+-siderophores transport system ATPase subunit [Cytobacillus purgationiresistens]
MVAKDQPVITGSVSDIMTEENMLNYFNIEVKKLVQEVNNTTFETIVPTYFGSKM